MIGYYTPAVQTALVALCLACSVGMYGAVLMVGRFGRYRQANTELPRRHDAAPSKFSFGRRPARKGGAA